MKVLITAIVTFFADTEDADQDLVEVDQAHDLAVMAMPHGFELEELVDVQPLPPAPSQAS